MACDATAELWGELPLREPGRRSTGLSSLQLQEKQLAGTGHLSVCGVLPAAFGKVLKERAELRKERTGSQGGVAGNRVGYSDWGPGLMDSPLLCTEQREIPPLLLREHPLSQWLLSRGRKKGGLYSCRKVDHTERRLLPFHQSL